jgi:hypothetical protein
MLKDKLPPRGSFDYLLDGNAYHDEPPQPPRKEDPRRVKIEIEIIERQQGRKAERRQDRRSALWWIVGAMIGVALVASMRHAHGEQRWQENRVGNQTYWYNPETGVRGQEWPMPDGSVRSTWQDPSGHVKDCVVQRFGNAVSTRCQ